MACKNDRTQPFIPLLIGVRFIQPGEPERRGEHRARGIQGTRERPCSEISEFLGLQLRQLQTGERLLKFDDFYGDLERLVPTSSRN